MDIMLIISTGVAKRKQVCPRYHYDKKNCDTLICTFHGSFTIQGLITSFMILLLTCFF